MESHTNRNSINSANERAENAGSKEMAKRIRHLERMLEARIDIDHAKAILMQKGLCENEAYGSLRHVSMMTRTPLPEIAKAVILADLVEHDGLR